MFDVATIGFLEMSFHERVVNFVQRTCELFAVSPSPIFAPDEAPDFSSSERDFFLHRSTVIGMLLDQCNKDLVGKLTWLPKTSIWSDNNVLFLDPLVEFDLLRARRCALCIV